VSPDVHHPGTAVAAYWLEHDSVPEIDWSRPGVRLELDPDDERPMRSITIRLPRRLMQELRVLAKDRDVPYQSLLVLRVVVLGTSGWIVARNRCPAEGRRVDTPQRRGDQRRCVARARVRATWRW
jgi:hypothetical protein